MVTRSKSAAAPRSTWMYWSSWYADDQRVPASPSTALPATLVSLSVEDAVAVRCRARSGPPPSDTDSDHIDTPQPVARWPAWMRTYWACCRANVTVWVAALPTNSSGGFPGGETTIG